jgi:hypothetical protein
MGESKNGKPKTALCPASHPSWCSPGPRYDNARRRDATL